MGLVEKWIRLISPWAARRKLALATEIARSSQPAVWQRVADRSPGMRASEVRGYIRARAAAVVHPQVDSAAAQHGFDGQRDELIELATNEVLRAIIRQWIQARPGETVTMPQRHAA